MRWVMSVTVGNPAPDFSLPDATGQIVQLSHYRGRWVVLYFYPKDDTPGCTAESCAFRDAYEALKERGAEVIGISADSPSSHRNFAQKHRLPFILLSDEQNQVRQRYGVPATLWILPGRVTYIIDPEGIVRKIFDSPFDVAGHVKAAENVIMSSSPS